MNMECSAQTVSGKINGHEYVDLGLPSGLKWATTNLSNYYYTWGDINHEYTFRCDDYKWCERKSNEPIAMQDANNSDLFRITKYGEKDGKTTLEAADDAATAQWKAPWRMPTAEELQELYDGCQWEYFFTDTSPRIIGFKGTSKYNGATILLPLGPDGGRKIFVEDEFMTVERSYVASSLWSSSKASTEWGAHCLMITHEFNGKKGSASGGVYSQPRYCGIHIRAVCR